MFDFERLEVYGLAIEFYSLIAGVVAPRGPRIVLEQLERAAMSVVLNVAEGAGRRVAADKRRFYTMARGSAMESAAALHLLRLRSHISDDDYATARHLLLSIVRMLSRLAFAAPEPAPEPVA